jgi:hypothetical protein
MTLRNDLAKQSDATLLKRSKIRIAIKRRADLKYQPYGG